MKTGALHLQLSIPANKHIPTTLLRAISRAEPGDVIKNPTNIGKHSIPVTHLLKKRVNFALSFR